MANKRQLKKEIRMTCEALFAEAVAVSLYSNKGQKENSNAMLFCIVKTQDNFLRRVCHPEPGMKAKVYYNDLREKFGEQVTEFLDHLNS